MVVNFGAFVDISGVSGDLRFLVTGFGWATAELICTRLVPFWIGARGVEFSWK